MAVKGRWLSETKKCCSRSPVAVKDVYGSSSAGYGRGKSGCAVSFFFPLFYFPFCSIHVQTNTIMILAIAKTNRNRSSNLSHINTHSHTDICKHRRTHITTYTCRHTHIYTHISPPPQHTHTQRVWLSIYIANFPLRENM